MAKGWQRRGTQLTVPAAGTNTRISVFGALNYATGVVTSQLAERADSAAFIAFLDKLVETSKNAPLTLVLDNAGYHKSTAVKAWFARHRATVTVLSLPPYCPELNLIERVWRALKHHLACHRYWNDVESLKQRTTYLLDHLIARFHLETPGGIQICHNLSEST